MMLSLFPSTSYINTLGSIYFADILQQIFSDFHLFGLLRDFVGPIPTNPIAILNLNRPLLPTFYPCGPLLNARVKEEVEDQLLNGETHPPPVKQGSSCQMANQITPQVLDPKPTLRFLLNPYFFVKNNKNKDTFIFLLPPLFQKSLLLFL